MEPSQKFKDLLDDLVLYSESDIELAEGLKWIDREAARRQISFYQMGYLVMHKYEMDERAQTWRKSNVSS